jgi:hypothetical protein
MKIKGILCDDDQHLVEKYEEEWFPVDCEEEEADYNLTTSSELKDLRKTLNPDSEKQAKEPSKTKRKRAKRNDSNYDEVKL